MKVLVVYKSKTGFARKYAEIIGREVKADVLELDKTPVSKMSEYDAIVYGAGLYAGLINGLKKAKEMFAQSTAGKFIIFATGATPNEAKDVIDEVWKNNLSENELDAIPHFYMQGGLCYEKMGFFSKSLMKMMAKTLEKQHGINSDDSSQGMSLRGSYDISSKEYTKEIVKYLLEA